MQAIGANILKSMRHASGDDNYLTTFGVND